MQMNGGSAGSSRIPGSGGLATYQNHPAEVARPSHVQEQMHRSACVIKSISDRVSLLMERLQPILRVEPQSGQAGKDAPKPTLVGHANALSNQNDQLEMVDLYVLSILDRLEL
jgi:hypothetical protein